MILKQVIAAVSAYDKIKIISRQASKTIFAGNCSDFRATMNSGNVAFENLLEASVDILSARDDVLIIVVEYDGSLL